MAGKYLLEDCLGIGGMGEVYRATNVSLGRKVAIKILSAEYVHIEEDVLRFLREARAAAGIRHDNVVDVIDVARDDDGTPFIVQELLAGEDLERYLKTRGRLSPEEALEIMIPVADAVAAAHAENVVHRDLKPANIFLARDRNKITPKVLDFGACLFPTIAARSAREIRMLIGTPHYMAPEQIVSKADVDARSDVWALGVILYEMIVGETPFEGETMNAVLELVKTREVPPLRQHSKEVSIELEALVAACTRRDRLARLPNAGVVHTQLLALRQRTRGGASSSRMETVTEMAAIRVPLGKSPLDTSATGTSPAPRVPSLDRPAAARPRAGLLTLNSPESEPPPSMDASDLDIPLPATNAGDRAPPASVQRPIEVPFAAASQRDASGLASMSGTSSGLRQFEADDDLASAPVELAARPSSWPPPSRPTSSRPGSSRDDISSMPPVLDPRSATRTTAHPVAIPGAPLPRDLAERVEQMSASHPTSAATFSPPIAAPQPIAAPRGPEAPTARAADFATRRSGWSLGESAKLAGVVALPALASFAVARFVPAIGAPVGHALRGDSPLASGILAVIALVWAAALCARSMFGEKSRWLYVAAGGAVLFAIVMIIVTSAATEAAELGVPSSMGGLAPLIAPLAPLALALGALHRARAAWLDPYARSEALRFAALASLTLFVALALSPIGVVRTAPPPPPTLRRG